MKQYTGARYVAKIYENSQDPESAEWESNVNYEALVIVTFNNGSYMSKKTVPAYVGNPATNPTYWTQTGFYNGQIAQLQNQVTKINAILSFLPAEYDDNTSYIVNSTVLYNGHEYIAIANTTGNQPTNTTYWTDLGDLDDRFASIITMINTKAAKDLFTPTDYPITMNDISAYTTSTASSITVTQVGRLLIVRMNIVLHGVNNPMPSGTVLNATDIPAASHSNIGFYLHEPNGTAHRMLFNYQNKITPLETLSQGTDGMVLEGDFVIPSYGWI